MIKNKYSGLTTLFPQHASLSLLQKANQQIAKQRWGSFVLGTGQVAQVLYSVRQGTLFSGTRLYFTLCRSEMIRDQ